MPRCSRCAPTLPLFASILAFATVAAQEPMGEVQRVVRSYDIRFLTEEIPQFPAQTDDFPAPSLALEESGDLAFSLEEDVVTAGTRISPEAIVALIRSNIAEDSWANQNNTIRVSSGKLIVVQTPQVQTRIAELLGALRARRARMVTVDVALVPPEALGDVDATQLSPLPEGSFQSILDRAGRDGQRISLTAYNGQTVSTFRGEHRTFLVDDEVNATGVTPVIDAVPQRFPVGLTVEARPQVVVGPGWVVLELLVSWLQVEDGVRKREGVFSEIETVPFLVEELETTLLLEPGKAVVAGVFEESGDPDAPRRFAVLARARPLDVQEPEALPSTGADGHFLRAYEIAFLLDAGTGARAPFDFEILVQSIRRNVDPEAWRDERARLELDAELLLVNAPRETHERVSDWLRTRFDAAGRTAVLHIEELQGSLNTILELRSLAHGNQSLPDDWKSAGPASRLRPVFRGSVRTLLGRPVSAQGIRARTYVADVQSVSGGTGFVVKELPDSDVAYSRSGFALETVLPLNFDAQEPVVDLDLKRYLTRIERQAQFSAATQLAPSALPDSGREDFRQAEVRETISWIPYELDLIDWEERHARARSSMPPGADVILELRELGDGQARIVLGRVDVTAMPEAEGVSSNTGNDARPLRVHDLGILEVDADIYRGSVPRPLSIRGHDTFDHDSDALFGEAARQEWVDTEFSLVASFDLDDVPAIVKQFIAADSWDNTRNSIEIREGRLAVVQHRDVISRIDALVDNLSARVARKVIVEFALVPAPVLDEVAHGWSRPGAPPWLPSEVLDRALRTAGRRASFAVVRVRSGAWANLVPQTHSTHITDHVVNQTGIIPVLNPRVQALRRGLFAESRVLLDSGRTWCRAEVILGRLLSLKNVVERRRLPRGDLDLVRGAQERLSTSVAGPLDRTLVLGSYAKPASDGDPNPFGAFVGLLRVRDVSVEVPTAAGGVAAIECGVLSVPFAGSRSFQWPEATSEHDGPPLQIVDPDLLKKDLLLALGDDSRLRLSSDSASVFLRDDAASIALVKQRLHQLTRENVRSLTLDLWKGRVDSVGLKKLDGGTALLGDVWKERFEDSSGLRVRTVGLSNVVQTLHSVASRSFVKNLERVSGGVDRTIVVVGDPVVSVAGEGLALKVQAAVVPGTPWAQLRVQGELAQEPVFQRKSRVRESQSVKVKPGKDGEVEAAGEWIEIDLPEERSENWEHLVTVPLGQPILLNALPDPDNPGKTRVLIAVVHAFHVQDERTGEF